MTISVALCTYNGQRFLHDQLASISQQTRLPDEMVVCDDASCDDTIQLLEAFARYAPFTVYIHRNDTNQGVTRSFERAIQLCQQNIIALSDQDDVWKPDKLAKIEQVFDSSSATGLVFSNAEVVDSTLKPRDYTLWRAVRFSSKEQRYVKAGRQLDVLLKHQIVTGATMAFRASLKDIFLPIPPVWFHDGWIALLISIWANIALIDQPLILYRQHGSNVVGAPAKALRAQTVEARLRKRELRNVNLAQYEAVQQRLQAQENVPNGEQVNRLLAAKVAHMRVRATLPDTRWRRVPIVIREMLHGQYHRFSSGSLSVAKDLVQQL